MGLYLRETILGITIGVVKADTTSLDDGSYVT